MKNLALTFVAFLMVIGIATAQDTNSANHNVTIKIPTVALLDIESGSGNDITLEVTAPENNEAGSPLVFTATNSDLWLNYTSIVAATKTRKIDATLANALPGGVSLKVVAGSVSTGKGTKGSAVTNGITLSGTAQSVITGIGSCYTDNGSGKGSNLTYSLAMDADAYGTLYTADYTVKVTYTITDAN